MASGRGTAMIAAKEKITPGQFMMTVIQAQIGVGVLFLPSSVQSVAFNDAWISVILSGVTAFLLILVMWGLARRFPSVTFLEYLPLLLGKVFGKTVLVFYAAFFILECSLVLVLFADVIKDWIFTNTPTWVILSLALIASLYIAQENIRTIARFLVLTFVLIFLLVIIAAYAFRDANILYILPINQSGFPSILKGVVKSMNSFYGFEMLLFCFPYVLGEGKSILKATVLANIFSTLFYTFLVFTCLIVFSPEELKVIPQPVLYMVKALSFTIIERADLYFMTIWAVVVVSTVIAYLFMSSRTISVLLGQKKHRRTAPYVALFILIISLIPHNQEMINVLQTYVGILSGALLVGFPLILLGISYGFGIKGKEQPG
ncbi:spore gernimation protein [Cohnella endophytica]|uniref:Spore gernimation protein n=1 Tax=Cohnella endophytica TaxID=2419778 RepID=A0A494XM15_9BACL|nr:GerAB/ArcD/ProY family transporter [Cohnella endophytica]RKP51737.1 spore gernimation protein [Cohnella endophytica]